MEKRKSIKADDVLTAASGRWLEIYESLCPAMSKAVKNVGRHVNCPFHYGNNDFRICNKKGRATGLTFCSCGVRSGMQVLMELNDRSYRETLEDLYEYLGMSEMDLRERDAFLAKQREAHRKWQEEEDRKNIEIDKETTRKLNGLWKRSIPLTDPKTELAVRYFRQRGIDPSVLTNHIRYNPGVVYRGESDEEVFTEFHPAILSRVYTNDGKPITIHRTYLDRVTGKKLGVKHPKKMMPPSPLRELLPGRIVPVTEIGNSAVLGIAEGIETAAAASIGFGIPVWSSISSGPLRNFMPPPQVEHLICYADLDSSGAGYESALALGENLKKNGWKGEYEIRLPPEIEGAKNVDWADILALYGPIGFKAA